MSPRLIAAAAALALAVLLAGCGGGDWPDEIATTDPVDCKAHPELCR